MPDSLTLDELRERLAKVEALSDAYDAIPYDLDPDNEIGDKIAALRVLTRTQLAALERQRIAP